MNDKAKPDPLVIFGALAPASALAFVAFREGVRTPTNKAVKYVRDADAGDHRGVRAYLSSDRRWIVLMDMGGEPSRHVPIENVTDLMFTDAVTQATQRKLESDAQAPATA